MYLMNKDEQSTSELTISNISDVFREETHNY